MKRVLIGLVRLYQRYISPCTKPSCRFEPTCSTYAIQALSRFGAVKGSLLALGRLLRCQPFGGHGYDPVPEEWPRRKKK